MTTHRKALVNRWTQEPVEVGQQVETRRHGSMTVTHVEPDHGVTGRVRLDGIPFLPGVIDAVLIKIEDEEV